MTFLEFLETLQKIRKRPNPADLEKLSVAVHHTYGKEGIQLLDKVLRGLELKQEEAHCLQLASYSDAAQYGVFYNHSLYQKILPLCQFAYLSEKNGFAEEHAFKLATLFANKNEVLGYFLHFKDVNPYQYLVHDACLFDLPNPECCDFEKWRSLAKMHLSNPRFREILPHAEALEEQIGQKKHPLDRNAIKQKKEELAHASKQYKKQSTQPARFLNETQRRERSEILKQLSVKKSALRMELANLCQGMPLREVDILVLEAFYERYLQKQEAHQLLIKNGISAKNIRFFNTLKRANDDNLIPDILIDGQELGYPGIYLKKLDIMSDKGAALAACLGKVTDCCQYFGGAGSSCVEHGISNAFSGFYVLFQGDAKNPSLDDTVLAQSWVWRGHDGQLCLDSIEKAHKADKTVVISMFRLLGYILCQKFSISSVNTGAHSGISDQVGFNYPASNTQLQNYKGYTDAKAQLLLSSNALPPYVFFLEKSAPSFREYLRKDVEIFSKNLFLDETSLHANTEIQKIINFIHRYREQSLLDVVRKCAGKRQAEFDRLEHINQKWFSKFFPSQIFFDDLKEGLWIDSINSEGESLLHRAIFKGEVEIVKKLIQEGININCQNNQKNTPLVTATHRLNFGLLIQEQRKQVKIIKALIETDRCNDLEKTLFWAANHGNEEIFNILLIHGANIQFINESDEKNILMVALEGGNTEILTKILESKSIDLNYKCANNLTALYYALKSKKPENLAVFLQHYPKKALVADLTARSSPHGTTLLDLVIYKEKHVQIILDFIPVSQRVTVLCSMGENDKTFLYRIFYNIKLLKDVLSILSPTQKAQALLNAQLDLSFCDNSTLKMLLEICPAILKNEGYRILLQVYDVLRIKTLFEFCSKDQIIEAMKRKYHGKTALHHALEHPEILQCFLQYLSDTHRIELLKLVDDRDKTVFQKAFSYPGAMKIILEFLSHPLQHLIIRESIEQKPWKRVEIIEPDFFKSLVMLFQHLSEHDRFAVLQFKIAGECIKDFFAEPWYSWQRLPAIQSSFINCYIKLERYINKNKTSSKFFHHRADPTLVKAFNQASSFDEVRANLKNAICDLNSNDELTNKLKSIISNFERDNLEEELLSPEDRLLKIAHLIG